MNAYPANPNMNEFEGKKCYRGLADIPDAVDGVIINVPPSQTEKVVVDTHTVGINKVWLQQGSQSGEAVKFCEDNNINCVSNECIIMFTEPLGFMHRAHKWIWGVLGKLPK